MSRTDNSLRNIFWGYTYKLLNMFLPFFFRSVMIKYMGSEYLGLNSLFTSVLQVLNLSELGVGAAISYSMYKPVSLKDDEMVCALLRLYRKIYIIIGIVILGVGTAIMPVLPHFIEGEYPKDVNIYVVYFLFLLNTSLSYLLFSYRSSILNASQRNDLISKISIIVIIIRYATEITVIVVAQNYYVCLLFLLFSTLINNLLNYWVSKKYYPQFVCRGLVSKQTKEEIKKKVFALMLHKIGGTVLSSVSTIVISAFLGLHMVTKYTNYFYVISAVQSMVVICFSSITSVLGNFLITERKDRVTQNFSRILLFNFMIVCVCSSLMLCLFQDFIKLWVGQQYLFENELTILFVAYFFIHTIRRTIIVFRDAAGMWEDNRLQPIVAVVVNVTLSLLLVQYTGIYGVLLSSIISMIFVDVPWEAYAFCRSKMQISPIKYILRILKYGIITAFACALSFFGCYIIPIEGIVGMAIKTIITVILNGVLLVVLYGKNPDFIFFKNLIVCKLKRMISNEN